MAYCSKEDLEMAITPQTLLDLCDDTQQGDWTTDDAYGFNATDRLTACILNAGRMVDSYAQAHFSVPFDPTPAMVKELAISLAVYYLYRRRRAAFGMPDDVKDEHSDAMKRLERINEGKLDLGLEPSPAASDKVVAQYDGPDQLFTSTSLKDF
jgi:phage gp36-like protein